MDYYDQCGLIEDLKVIISSKENELMNIQLTNTTNDVNQNIRINQLFYEIQEIRTQLTYHQNVMNDMLMTKCINCCNGKCQK